MWKKIVIGVISLVLVLGAVVVFTGSEAGGEVYRVGLLLPMSGSFASYGEDVQRGLEIARDDIKKQEGIDIEFVLQDTSSDPKVAVSAAKQMVEVGDIPLAISGPGSSVNLALAPLFEEAGRPFFVVSQTPRLNKAGKYIFKMSPDVNKEGEMMAGYVVSKNIKNIGIVYDVTSDTSTVLKDVLVSTIGKLGGTATAESIDPKSGQDYRSSLTKFKDKNLQGIYLAAGQDKVTIQVITQLKELGINLPYFGWSPFETNLIIKGTNGAVEGATYTALPFSCEYGTDAMKAYCEKFEHKYPSVDALHFGPQAYDTLFMIAQVLKSEGVKPDEYRTQSGRDKVVEGILKLKNYSGVSGQMPLNDDGNITEKDFVFRIVKDQKFVPLDK